MKNMPNDYIDLTDFFTLVEEDNEWEDDYEDWEDEEYGR